MIYMISGFRLNTSILMIKSLSQWMDCVVECAKQPCCRSINYKQTSQNESNCEMLHNLVHNTSEKLLERNPFYGHVYLINPHKV